MSRQALVEAKTEQARSSVSAQSGLLEQEVVESNDFDLKKSQKQRIAKHNFSQLQVRNTLSPVIQPKLKIGKPGDKYEQEADRIADQVMRVPETSLQRQVEGEEKTQLKPFPATSSVRLPPVKTGDLQAKEKPGQQPAVTSQFQDQISSLHGGGEPLSQSVRAFFEPRFGVDFSSVRIHNSPKAVEAAHSINARAFTLGQDIVFGKNDPNAGDGRRLLAHELTHVLQQTGGKELTYQSHVFEDPQLLAHESTYTLQQGQTDVLRLKPDDELGGERTPKAKRIVVVSGLGGKGKNTAGIMIIETDQGPIEYGLKNCNPLLYGEYKNVLVQKDVTVDGKKEGLFFNITKGTDETGQNEIVDFEFEFKENFGTNPDPRTLFDFSDNKMVLIDIIVNPHENILNEIKDEPLEKAGLRISEAYNEVELKILRKVLEAKLYNAIGEKHKDHWKRLLLRVEHQLVVAETQAIRAGLDDELKLDSEMSERIEDHPELASRLAALNEKLILTIIPTAEKYDYEEPGFFTEDNRALAKEIRKVKKVWAETVESSPNIGQRDAADQSLRLKAAIQLLGAYRQIETASRGVKDIPDVKQRFAQWNILVQESLIEAEFLSGTAFIQLGERRLEVRDKLEKHDKQIKLAVAKLKTASLAKPTQLTAAGTAVTSHALAGDLLRDDFSATEVREALERLSEDNPSRFDLVMSSGQFSWAFLELAEASGKGKEAAKAELSSLHSMGQGFLVGYSLRARELELSDPNGLNIDLSGGSIVATVRAMVNGLIAGFGKGLRQITVDLIEFIAVKSVREKIIAELIQIVTKSLTEEKFRFVAGVAIAELIHDETQKFNESNSQVQAASIGNILGQIIFEILQDLLGGAAFSAAGKAAKFSKLQAVLRLVRMTSANAFSKAVASKLFDLTKVAAKVGVRVGNMVGTLHRKIPGFTSGKKFANAVHDMKANDLLQLRVVDAAKEMGQALDHMEALADLPKPDSKKLSQAVENLRKSELKLELEVYIYNKKARADDTLFAVQDSIDPSNGPKAGLVANKPPLQTANGPHHNSEHQKQEALKVGNGEDTFVGPQQPHSDTTSSPKLEVLDGGLATPQASIIGKPSSSGSSSRKPNSYSKKTTGSSAGSSSPNARPSRGRGTGNMSRKKVPKHQGKPLEGDKQIKKILTTDPEKIKTKKELETKLGQLIKRRDEVRKVIAPHIIPGEHTKYASSLLKKLRKQRNKLSKKIDEFEIAIKNKRKSSPKQLTQIESLLNTDDLLKLAKDHKVKLVINKKEADRLFKRALSPTDSTERTGARGEITEMTQLIKDKSVTKIEYVKSSRGPTRKMGEEQARSADLKIWHKNQGVMELEIRTIGVPANTESIVSALREKVTTTIGRSQTQFKIPGRATLILLEKINVKEIKQAMLTFNKRFGPKNTSHYKPNVDPKVKEIVIRFYPEDGTELVTLVFEQVKGEFILPK